MKKMTNTEIVARITDAMAEAKKLGAVMDAWEMLNEKLIELANELETEERNNA